MPFSSYLTESKAFVGVRPWIIAATVWVYWGSLAGPFHYDDYLFLQSSRVTSAEGLWATLSPTQLRQFTYLTFHLNYMFGGADPAGYHVVNVLIHALNVLLLGFVLHGFARIHPEHVPRWLPTAAAAVFGLHPIQSEAVNYIYQRSTLLAAAFSLIALALMMQSLRKRNRAVLVIAAAAYVLAVASKESAVVLPLVGLAYGWAYGRSGVWRPRVWRTAAAAAAAAAGLTFWQLWNLYRAGEATVGLSRWTQIPGYAAAQIQVFASYLRLIFWPSGLTIEHDFRPLPFTSVYGIACAVLLAALVAALVLVRARNPAAAFLGAAFLVFLVPTSTLIPSADLMFEHRLYLPMLAGAALLGWAVLQAGALLAPDSKVRTVVQTSLLVALLALGGYLSMRRVEVWADDVRLWEEAAARAPASPRAHYNLGVALLDADRERAQAAFLKALQFQPRHAAALYNLGWIEQAGGRTDAARRYYEAAIGIDAGLWKAHHGLANLAVFRGSLEEARVHYEAVVRLNPDYWPPYESLAAVLVQLGKPDAALALLENARQRSPFRARAGELISRIRADGAVKR